MSKIGKAAVTAENDRKTRFIDELASYLVDDQAGQSIRLQMGQPQAQRWAALRGSTPLTGYPSHSEAVQLLTEWFARGMR